MGNMSSRLPTRGARVCYLEAVYDPSFDPSEPVMFKAVKLDWKPTSDGTQVNLALQPKGRGTFDIANWEEWHERRNQLVDYVLIIGPSVLKLTRSAPRFNTGRLRSNHEEMLRIRGDYVREMFRFPARCPSGFSCVDFDLSDLIPVHPLAPVVEDAPVPPFTPQHRYQAALYGDPYQRAVDFRPQSREAGAMYPPSLVYTFRPPKTSTLSKVLDLFLMFALYVAVFIVAVEFTPRSVSIDGLPGPGIHDLYVRPPVHAFPPPPQCWPSVKRDRILNASRALPCVPPPLVFRDEFAQADILSGFGRPFAASDLNITNSGQCKCIGSPRAPCPAPKQAECPVLTCPAPEPPPPCNVTPTICPLCDTNASSFAGCDGSERQCYGLFVDHSEAGVLCVCLLFLGLLIRRVHVVLIVPLADSIAKETKGTIRSIYNALNGVAFIVRVFVKFVAFIRKQVFVLTFVYAFCCMIQRYPPTHRAFALSPKAMTLVSNILTLYSVTYSVYEWFALIFLAQRYVPYLFAFLAFSSMIGIPAIYAYFSRAVDLKLGTGFQSVNRRPAVPGGKPTPVLIYRASVKDKWMEVGKDKVVDVSWSDEFISESVITDAKKVLVPPGIKGPGGVLSIVIPELLEGRVVEETHSHCWAYTVVDGPDAGDYIVTARHCVHPQDFPGHPKVPCGLDLTQVTIKNRIIERKSQQTKWNTSVLDLTSWTAIQWRSPVFVGNCFDIVAFKAPSFRTIKGKQVSYRPFTDLGVPALTRKDICCQRGATASIYTHEVQNGVSHMTMSEGLLGDFPKFERETGMLLHSVNTVGGHSGAPLWLTRKNGKRQVCAMHIGQSIGPDGNVWNFALSMPTILRFFQMKGVKCKDSFALYRERMNNMPNLEFSSEARAQDQGGTRGTRYTWVRVGNEWIQYEDDGRSQEDFDEPDEDRYDHSEYGTQNEYSYVSHGDGDAPLLGVVGNGSAGDAEAAHDAAAALSAAENQIKDYLSAGDGRGYGDALGRRASRSAGGPIHGTRLPGGPRATRGPINTSRPSWAEITEEDEGKPEFIPEQGTVNYGALFQKELLTPLDEAYYKTLTPNGYLPLLPGIDTTFSNAYYAKKWDRSTEDGAGKALIRPLSEIRELPICNPDGRVPIGQIIEQAWAEDSLDFLSLIQQYSPQELLDDAEAIHHNQYRAASFASWGSIQETFTGIGGVPIYQHVGDCNALHAHSEERVEIDDPFLDAAAAQGVELRDATGQSIFVRPAINPEVVTQTLKNQAAKLSHTNWNAADGHVPPNITEGYPKHEAKCFGKLKGTMENIIQSMDPDKSAGFSAHYKSGPKEVWIGPDQTALLSIAIYRLLLIIALGPVAMGNMSPEEHVFYGTSDCVTMFGKDELNKRKKVDSGLLRLIWPAAIIKNFVTALLTQMFNKECIAAYQDGECTKLFTGVGHSDPGLKHMTETIKKILTDPADGGRAGGSNKDCEAYDLTVTRDSQMMCCSVIIANTLPIDTAGVCPVDLEYICRGDQFDPAVLEERGLTQTYCSLMHSVSLLDGAHCCVIRGKIWATTVAGTTASGGVNTTTYNSIGQTAGHEICGIPQNASGGDDNIARKYAAWNEKLYADLGFKIKPGSYTEFGPYGPIDFNGLIGTGDPETDEWTWKYNNIAKLYSNARLRIPDQASVADPKVQSAILAYQFCLRHVDGVGNWDSFVKTFKGVGIDLYLMPETIYLDHSAVEPFVNAETELGLYRTIIEIEDPSRIAHVVPEARRQPATLISDEPAAAEILALRAELASLRAELVSARPVVTASPAPSEIDTIRAELAAMSALMRSLIVPPAVVVVTPESRVPRPKTPPAPAFAPTVAVPFVGQAKRGVPLFGQAQARSKSVSPPANTRTSQGRRQRVARADPASASTRPAPGLDLVQQVLSRKGPTLSASLERACLRSIEEETVFADLLGPLA